MTKRPPRFDLGVEVRVVAYRDRDRQGCFTISGTDFFGNVIDMRSDAAFIAALLSYASSTVAKANGILDEERTQ